MSISKCVINYIWLHNWIRCSNILFLALYIVFQGPFKCDTCEKVFPKWPQYQRHMKAHDEDKPFRCPHCTMSFNVVDNLRLHVATHVPADGEPTCPECGKKFSRIASLKAHIMLHEKEENLMCTECGDEFSLQVGGSSFSGWFWSLKILSRTEVYFLCISVLIRIPF